VVITRRRRRELHELTGAYALDALEPEELAAFERHLDRCGRCAAEVRGMRETAARLAADVAVQPPPQFRERVLAAARQTRQLPPLTAKARRIRLPRPRLSLTITTVSLAAAVALGIIAIHTSQQLGDAHSRDQAIAAVLSAPDARLGTARSSSGGIVTVIASRTEGEAIITSTGLPSLPADRTYEAWVISTTGAVPAGLFVPGPAGHSTPLLTDVTPGVKIGVTVEPAGGTRQPTTTVLVALPLPS
jgi:anti-sigma-K factor RskA